VSAVADDDEAGGANAEGFAVEARVQQQNAAGGGGGDGRGNRTEYGLVRGLAARGLVVLDDAEHFGVGGERV